MEPTANGVPARSRVTAPDLPAPIAAPVISPQKDFENSLMRVNEERRMFSERNNKFRVYNWLFATLLLPVASIAAAKMIPGFGPLGDGGALFFKCFAVFYMLALGVANLGVSREMWCAVAAEREVVNVWLQRRYADQFPPIALTQTSHVSWWPPNNRRTPTIVGTGWLILAGLLLVCI